MYLFSEPEVWDNIPVTVSPLWGILDGTSHCIPAFKYAAAMSNRNFWARHLSNGLPMPALGTARQICGA